MKTGLALVTVAILLAGGVSQLRAQLPRHEADIWTTPAYAEGGALATPAYGESGPWVTSAFTGVDAGTLKGGLGGGGAASPAAGPGASPRSSFGLSPIIPLAETWTSKRNQTAQKGAVKVSAISASTNAPGILPSVGITNAVPTTPPAEGSPGSTAVPSPPAKPPVPGETGQ